MKDNSFEHIIKDRLANAESVVPSSTWSAVSSQISLAGKSVAFLSTVLGKIALVAVIASSVGIVSYFSSPSATIDQETIEASSQTSSEDVKTAIEEKLTEVTIPKTNLEPIVSPKKSNSSIKADLSKTQSATEDTKEKSINDQTPDPLTAADNILQEPASKNKDAISSAVETSDFTHNDLEKAEELPSSIFATLKNEGKNLYLLELDLASESQYSVVWYINEEEQARDLVFSKELSSGEHLIMARIFNEKTLVQTLFDTLTVKVTPRISVPNTFTPHSSKGYNDVFDIDHAKSENIAGYEIEVYSESGLVFTSSESNISWNGYINGNEAPVGVYTYKINYWSEEGQTRSQTGTLLLQR